jgi:hypothetical protein
MMNLCYDSLFSRLSLKIKTIAWLILVVSCPLLAYSWSDLDMDGRVNLKDFVYLAMPDVNSLPPQQSKFRPPDQNDVFEPISIADLDGNEIVDVDDLAILASEWLTNDYSEYSRVPKYGKYISPDIVQTFESTSEFTSYGTGAVMTASNAVFRTGLSGLKLENPADSTVSISGCGIGWDKGSANKINLQYHNFRVRYFLPSSPTPPFYLLLYFYNGPVDSDNKGIIALPAHAGWNTVEFGTHAISPFGTFDIAQPVQTIVLNYGPAEMAPGAYVVWNLFEAWPTGLSKGAVIFTFDDGYEGSYLYGINYLHQFGYRSMFYVAGIKIGTDRFCTWEELHAAEADGALICTHGERAITYPNYDNATDDEIAQWCIGRKQYLLDNGFTQGVDYFALPEGQKRLNGIPSVRGPQDFVILRKLFKHIRGIQPFWEDAPDGFRGNIACMPRYPREVWWGHCITVSQDDEANFEYVEAAVNHRDVVVFQIHNLDYLASDNVTILVQNFKNLVDYVKTKVDAGLLDVITFEDMVNNE